jgi:hypothetical protein
MSREEIKSNIQQAISILEDELKWQKSHESDNCPEIDISIYNIERCLLILRKEVLDEQGGN